VNSRTTPRFRKAYNGLPPHVQKQADEAFALFQQNPYHPGLHFKRVHSTQPIFSARVTLHYRALGVLEGETLLWFWIGSHADYDQLLARL
jgi:hypothetical protein